MLHLTLQYSEFYIRVMIMLSSWFVNKVTDSIGGLQATPII